MKTLEEIREALTGPVTSVFTPFQRDGSIDFAGLRRFIDVCIDGGSTAIILTAGDSRYAILSDAEIGEVTRVTAEHTAGRALVVAADKSWGANQELEFAQYARKVGADMLMVKPPNLTLCGLENFVAYYSAVCEHIPVMVVTNVFVDDPLGHGLLALKALRDRVRGIKAVKDDVCGEFARKLGLMVHEHWAVISGGQKQNHMNMLPYGCDGYFSTYSKFAPSVARAYWEAVEADDWPRMREIIATYDMPYFNLLLRRLSGPFFAGAYGTLELFGVIDRWTRPPYYSLNEEEMDKLADFFQGLSLL